jgi:peptidoglycan/LPS O-acetylase OafA/YrhL
LVHDCEHPFFDFLCVPVYIWRARRSADSILMAVTFEIARDVPSETASAPAPREQRILELDGIRGVAVLAVVFYHYAVIGPGAQFHTMLYWGRAAFRLGWSGVDLFFVLSGFLIGGILLDARNSPRYFQTFYARRGFRILPLYYLWLALYPLAVAVYSRWGIPELAQTPQLYFRWSLHWVFLQTLTFLFPVSYRTVAYYWLGPTWSLAIEEQFYLVVAPLVRILTTRRLLYVLLGSLVVCPVLRLFGYFDWLHSHWVIPLMLARADSFAAGILAALAWKTPAARAWIIARRSQLSWTLAVLFLGPLIFTKWYASSEDLFAQAFKLEFLATFFALLILNVLANSSGWLAWLMRNSVLREMGRLSYCIYIIHLSVLAGCFAFFLHDQPRLDTPASFLVVGFSFVLTYCLAWLSWKYFEGPMLRRGHAYKY